jgi:hypothetical protein
VLGLEVQDPYLVINLSPELPPKLLLLDRQLGQFRLLSDGNEMDMTFPKAQFACGSTDLNWATDSHLHVPQLGGVPEPFDGTPPPFGAFSCVEFLSILALPGSGQGGSAGGTRENYWVLG